MAFAKVYNGEVSEANLFKLPDNLQQSTGICQSSSTLPIVSHNPPISSTGSIQSANAQLESPQNTYYHFLF